ncbi:hypothetical protein VMT65_07685 [Nocardia sp. CDC153]|uniref:hypothetical protein n=1 Tax=Nocardia sp. CDC153 TaxID=3112167 RepID=UPI002DC01893|nr:hypothetical protein [Nocardia sp. CDC153]MEC3952906.1 hypothetical protein [Nocardia sp. CDC153]
MIEAVFTTVQSVEALLRAAVVFKFECQSESHLYAGSPQFADGVHGLLNTIIQNYRESGDERRAKNWEDLYVLDNPERFEFVRSYSKKHPKWNTMNDSDKKVWLDVVAAPYRIRQADYQLLLRRS